MFQKIEYIKSAKHLSILFPKFLEFLFLKLRMTLLTKKVESQTITDEEMFRQAEQILWEDEQVLKEARKALMS